MPRPRIVSSAPAQRSATVRLVDAARGLARAGNARHHSEIGRGAARRCRRAPRPPRSPYRRVMTDIDVLLTENRKFAADPAFRRAAHISSRELYDYAAADPVGFWEGMARELSWTTPWTKALDWTPPHVKWFVGGKLNASYNCVDRHVTGPRRNKAALVWEGEPGDRRTLTYWD